MQARVVPEGFGTAIPSSPAELLKFIQAQKQIKVNASNQNLKHHRHNASGIFHAQDISQERLKKQDTEREKYECIQMQQEDYIFTHEGVQRFKLIEERLKM